MRIEVTSEALNAMLDAAKNAHPLEACGILIGQGERIRALIPTRNLHPTPKTHFEIDPQALIDAHRTQREGGLCVLGYFHSHPTGDPHPSETDRAQSPGDDMVWAIAAGDRLMFWQDSAQGFHPLSYDVIER